MGKDIGFITAFYRKSPVVVAPIPYTVDAQSAPSYSSDEGALDAAGACKAQDEDARLPDRDELASMFVNKNLMNTAGYFWSGSIISAGSTGLAWYQEFHTGYSYQGSRSTERSVRCIKK